MTISSSGDTTVVVIIASGSFSLYSVLWCSGDKSLTVVWLLRHTRNSDSEGAWQFGGGMGIGGGRRQLAIVTMVGPFVTIHCFADRYLARRYGCARAADLLFHFLVSNHIFF